MESVHECCNRQLHQPVFWIRARIVKWENGSGTDLGSEEKTTKNIMIRILFPHIKMILIHNTATNISSGHVSKLPLHTVSGVRSVRLSLHTFVFLERLATPLFYEAPGFAWLKSNVINIVSSSNETS